MTPKENIPLFFNQNFYHNTAFNFYTYNGSQLAGPSTRITFDQKGIRVGHGRDVFSGAGLSVGGGWIVAGSNTNANNNYIAIYATGRYDNGTQHGEVMASNELSVGTKNGAFMYFKNIPVLPENNLTKHRIGINKQDPQATLDIDGSIRIGKCGESEKCTKDNVGEIRYYEKSNKGYFVGCRRKSNGSANTNFERVILSDGTTTVDTVSNDCTTPDVPYDPSSYQDQGVLAQEQPACK